MGWRFYRRFRVFPGLRLNLSRSGISTSIGPRGAHITIGHGKVRETVGLTGTGLSYTHVEGTHQEARSEAHPAPATEVSPAGQATRGWLWILLAVVIGALLVRVLML